MGTADDFLDRYAALPSAERNSAGVRPPSASLRLSVLYRPIQPPSSSMKRAGGPVRPVPAVPELPLEQAEEAPPSPRCPGCSPWRTGLATLIWTVPGGAQETGRPCARSCARAAGRGCLGTAPVNSVYDFDDRVVLNINFTDDGKTVTREKVLGSSAVDNVPTCWDRTR